MGPSGRGARRRPCPQAGRGLPRCPIVAPHETRPCCQFTGLRHERHRGLATGAEQDARDRHRPCGSFPLRRPGWGHCDNRRAVPRISGCARFGIRSRAGSSRWPFQSIRWSGSPSRPSHHTSLSSVSATFVKTVFARRDGGAFALGLDFQLVVPRARTPKKTGTRG